jgi:hypothetical protein
MAVIMEPSMLHVGAIPWKAAYGPQVKNKIAFEKNAMPPH